MQVKAPLRVLPTLTGASETNTYQTQPLASIIAGPEAKIKEDIP